MINGIMTITLKSDLCSGSGFSYAGTVDTDVIYDKYGFPYIPGKRIKGCMRDAAVMMGWPSEKILSAFGVRGAESNTGIRVGNAVLPNAREMSDEIDALSKNDRKYLSQQNILNQFTSVRSQTRIDETTGIAAENTLRFTRVVNHYLPKYDNLTDGKEETVFQADISFDANVTEEDIKNLAKATRNIGLNRKRGLGAVKIEVSIPEKNNQKENTKELCDERETINTTSEDNDNNKPWEVSGDGKTIYYCLTNTEPLIISAESDDESVGYIPGTAVLGALASEYLKTGMATDDFFKRVFLKGEVKFSNLTPAIKDGESYRVTYPAPLYMQKMKKSKEIINLLDKPEKEEDLKTKVEEALNREVDETEIWRYSPQNGNQPKKLKTAFVAEDEQGITIYEPKYEIAYHHRKKSTEMDEQLYFFNVLEPGQLFAGEIVVKNVCDMETVKNLLTRANLCFGKSKSAQYGMCELVNLKKCDGKCTAGTVLETPEGCTETQDLKKSDVNCTADTTVGKKVAVRFLSDGIFVDDSGNYTVNRSDILKKVADELGLTQIKGADELNLTQIDDDPRSCTLDSGCCTDELEPTQIDDGKVFLQTKVLTGYMSVWNLQKEQIPAIAAGSVIEYEVLEGWKASNYNIGEKTNEGFGKVAIEYIDNMKYVLTKHKETDNAKNEIKSGTIKAILLKERVQEKYEETLNNYNIKTDLNSSAIGRLTLMLDEAVAGNTDVEKQMEDFYTRIKSIKNEKNTKAEDFYNKIEKIFDNESDKELKESLKKMRMKLAKDVLVRMKYAKKD